MILLASGNVASFQEGQQCRCGQDNSTVAALSGDAQLTVGTPEKLGPVIRIDREWERGGVFPINVLRVGDAWHLYYSATSCLKGPGIVGNDFQGQCDARHGRTGAVCLATSRRCDVGEARAGHSGVRRLAHQRDPCRQRGRRHPRGHCAVSPPSLEL